MTNSIMRFPRSMSLNHLAGITRAVECGFMAAGITVTALAAFQSLVIVAGWIRVF